MAARVIVVGAGPAGIRAAEALVEAGYRPLVVDEGRRDGGQIYRRQPDGFTRSYEALYGTEATRAAAVHRTFDALKREIDYVPDTLVWNVTPGELHVVTKGRYHALAFDGLIICTGATDRLMPVKGWQHAGVYSLGGAQIALKSQGCAIGGRPVLMGSGPLLYLLAAQYVKAGANLVAVLDTSTRGQRLAALPAMLAIPSTLVKGAKLLRTLRNARIAVRQGIRPLEILGSSNEGVRGVVVEQANGTKLELACDAVALGYHLRPETQLAELAGCAFEFDEAGRQWVPSIDDDGRSSVKGVYLAGDGARVRGADAAERAGRLAALAALHDLGTAGNAGDASGSGAMAPGIDDLRRALARYTRFAAGLARAFPWPAQEAARLPDDAIVCRCESITAGALREVVCSRGACEANRAKAFSRVGMGRCQGRYCGHAGAEVIAAAAGVPLKQVGRLRSQAPVKPLPMAIIEDVEA